MLLALDWLQQLFFFFIIVWLLFICFNLEQIEVNVENNTLIICDKKQIFCSPRNLCIAKADSALGPYVACREKVQMG